MIRESPPLKQCLEILDSRPKAWWVGYIQSLENDLNRIRRAAGADERPSTFEYPECAICRRRHGREIVHACE